MSETIHPPVCPRCGRNQKAKYTVDGTTMATAWTCNSRLFVSPDGCEDFVQSKICTLTAQLAAETKRADGLGDRLDNVCGQLETLRRAEIRTSDLRERLAAAEARAKGLVEELQRYRKVRGENFGPFNPSKTSKMRECEAWSKVLALLSAGEEAKDGE